MLIFILIMIWIAICIQIVCIFYLLKIYFNNKELLRSFEEKEKQNGFQRHASSTEDGCKLDSEQ